MVRNGRLQDRSRWRATSHCIIRKYADLRIPLRILRDQIREARTPQRRAIGPRRGLPVLWKKGPQAGIFDFRPEGRKYLSDARNGRLSGRNVWESGSLRSKLTPGSRFSINYGDRPDSKKRLPGPSPIRHNRNSSDRVKTADRRRPGASFWPPNQSNTE